MPAILKSFTRDAVGETAVNGAQGSCDAKEDGVRKGATDGIGAPDGGVEVGGELGAGPVAKVGEAVGFEVCDLGGGREKSGARGRKVVIALVGDSKRRRLLQLRS